LLSHDTLYYLITPQRLHHSKHSLSRLGTFGHVWARIGTNWHVWARLEVELTG
jgi:hypothetical protein